ncbi:MAG: endopeptidase La [Deltaproteobacteria bacterium]|nr:endopeptidase La [Deltaproteobacteria bacterium]
MKTYPKNITIPVLPIRNVVIFPGTAFPLSVGRTKSVAAVKEAEEHKSRVFVVAQKEDQGEVRGDQLYRFGTLCELEKVRAVDGGYRVFVRGISRARVNRYEERDGLIAAEVEAVADVIDVDEKTEAALLSGLKEMSSEILELVPGDTSNLSELLDGITDLVFLTNLCSANLDLPLKNKQELLELVSVKGRVLALMEQLQKLKDGLQIQSEIRDKLGQRLGKHQREALLREQLKAIREELGDEAGEKQDDDYRKKIEDAGMPEETKKIALDELKRLEGQGGASAESHVIRNYLDLLVALPWAKSAEETLELDHARATLEADHYGLEKIKSRIVQHLAVLKLRKNGKGSILLFVGPPGVGKTSLGQSIAKALGRKFVRASLGGVRDDAEIRGHRRTYVGAMPGRIIQSIKRAGENNPVLMLDEIDKLGMGYHGDPASALLEVLDPEQNGTFHDHYLDVPFDLSKVFFIATANSLETIPRPLLDRMELIELSGYTTAEKLHIAKNHLVPKQLAEHGLTTEQAALGDEALLKIINGYTREAGVRDLQRKIGTAFRATTEKVLAKDAQLPIRIGVDALDEVLGPERFTHEVAERLAPPGVVTGLAWTPLGGEILFIEGELMPGTGKLILTGQLGDVMKESAQIALSLVRSKLAGLVPQLDFEKKDLHVHVPAGAIPKDGPSAGITMLTTLASLFTGRVVDTKTAMTGEVTLRGAVMPVGGIKEKVLAAHRAGITRIILSKRNERDLRDVPEEVRSRLQFELVDNVTQVIKLTLGLDVPAIDPALAAPPPPNPPIPVAVA